MLDIQKISFSYGKKMILEDFSLRVEDGEILALMGPSGCGKSTLLSLIAGLRRPARGEIVSDLSRIAFVFQEPRLFPWLTVWENLEAPLESPAEHAERIRAALDTVMLSDARDLYPRELSGGMRSRVALARALVYGGDLYLLDEPFAALDEELRRTLAEQLRAHIKKSGATAILVTHQSEDAALIADRTVTMHPLQADG